ncbi:MAG TPA: glutathione transferase GstA [Polyangiaceae bacterium]|jgi:glutathione S-transferase
MKLYFSPSTCSLHPHIALRETGLPFELVRVDTRAHKTSDGRDYYAINPKGYVPALELDDGSVLTEGAVIDQYIADQKPEAKIIPPAGTLDRYRVQEWLNFIASEIHKAFAPLFGGPDEAKELARTKIAKRFDFVAKRLDEHPYLVGDAFSVADGYLFNMLTWTQHTGIDLARWPSLQAFFTRMKERPSVRAALAAERS